MQISKEKAFFPKKGNEISREKPYLLVIFEFDFFQHKE